MEQKVYAGAREEKIKLRTVSITKVVCKTKHAFALRLRVPMLITILQCICSNLPKNLLITCPHPPPPPHCAVPTQRLVSGHVYEVNIASVLVDQKIKIPA